MHNPPSMFSFSKIRLVIPQPSTSMNAKTRCRRESVETAAMSTSKPLLCRSRVITKGYGEGCQPSDSLNIFIYDVNADLRPILTGEREDLAVRDSKETVLGMSHIESFTGSQLHGFCFDNWQHDGRQRHTRLWSKEAGILYRESTKVAQVTGM